VGWTGGQDFSGLVAACQRHDMGVLNIRIWAGGVLASPEAPARLFVMTSDTDRDHELRCAAAVRRVLRDEGSPAQAALRFALGNSDFSARVVGISSPDQLREALDALARGPLPAAALSRLGALWRNGFSGD
jgi:aryl-alcohol dehydrogenase-like predicted oxidoreductase